MTRAVGWSESFAEFNNQVSEVSRLDNSCVTIPWRQKELSKLVEEADFNGLLSSHKIRDQARLRALTCKGASAWLNAIPSFHMRQVFPNAQYVILLRLWLGLNVYDSEFPCPTCGNHMDVSGFHALTCKSGGYLGVRHNSLRDEFFMTCQSAQLAPKRETPFLLADSQDRPADVFLPSFSLGRPLCLDFAITHPLQKKFLKDASGSSGVAANMYASKVKDARYAKTCLENDLEFSPMVVEVFGGWCTKAAEVFSFVSKMYASKWGGSVSIAKQGIMQRLSVTLQQ